MSNVDRTWEQRVADEELRTRGIADALRSVLETEPHAITRVAVETHILDENVRALTQELIGDPPAPGAPPPS